MNKLFVGLLTILLFHRALDAADKIRIGYPDASGTFLSLPLGQTGFFQKEGIQAELIRIRSTVALTALVSGDLDYHSVLGPAVAAAIRGVPLKIVACFTPRVATAIIALPQFKSVQDLRDGIVKTYADDLTLPEDGLRLLIDEAKKNAKLNREISIDQVADLSILREMQKEAGIRER